MADNHDYLGGSSTNTISQGRYIGGGVASVLGFGIGQAIQGRWKERGWIHTTVQSVAVLCLWGSVPYTVSGRVTRPEGSLDLPLISAVLTAGSVFVILGSKIWEMVDTWILPDSMRVISSSHKIAPSFYSYKPELNVSSIRLQWQF